MWINPLLLVLVHLMLCTFVSYCTLCTYTITMHTKVLDNLSRERVDHPFMLDINDCCDYKDNTKDYKWTDCDFITINLNIRGLYSKITELNELIKNVESSGSSPSALTISEIWLTKHSPSFEVPGYKVYRKDREHKKGGGVAVLISNKLSSREIKYETNSSAMESCIVEIKGSKKPIIVCSLYRPPNTDIKLFLKTYRTMITKL